MSYRRKVEPILVKTISSNNTETKTETSAPFVSSDIVTNIIIGTASLAVLVGVIFIIIFSAGI